LLTGITVIDFTRHLPGDYCGIRLAGMGAEVIKVESFGDPVRHVETGIFAPEVQALFPDKIGRKKSVLLNLRAPEGCDLAFALAAEADVVIEGFRPGVVSHLGLDYAALREAKPELIYCSITGFGQTGTMGQLGGHDLNYQAVSGFLGVNRDVDGRPVVAEIPLAELAGGLFAAEQICAALVQKERSEKGAYLDIALVDVLASWLALRVLPEWPGQRGRESRETGFPCPRVNYNVYEAADGRFVALAALEEKFWLNFCSAVGREDWEPYGGLRVEEAPELYEEMKGLFLTRTQAEWNEFGMEVDCCLTAVEEADTWARSMYVQSRRFAASAYDEPPVQTPPQSVQGRMAETALSAGGSGADTHDVLRNKLGIGDSELRKYSSLGIIPDKK
jgi:crotonobetainyl-CoA:carnitine CoA-transferase CaiB-like acyl-CoA transferase